MDEILRDLRVAGRQLWKDKGFLAAVALTLALVIGVNTTMFAVIHAVILRPLPFAEPDRLVTMWNAYPGAGVGADVRGMNGAPDYFDRRGLRGVFEEVAVYRTRGRTLEIDGIPQRVTSQEVSPSFFPLLQAQAALGRTFTEEEQEPGRERVVLLGHALWLQLFSGRASAVGGDLRIDGRPYTVVGVLPEGFRFLEPDARLWTPIAFTQEERQSYHSNNWHMVARLGPGVSLVEAQERLDALNSANMDQMPELRPLLIDAGFHTPLHLLQDDLVRDVRSALFLLWGGVGFVLLIGCVNVANLLLIRSTARARELATRFALGASRRRILRQVVTEVLLLALAGGALGLLLAHAGLRAVVTLGFGELPRGEGLELDATAVVFTVGLAAAVALLVSLLPVASIGRVRLTSVFREEGRGGTAGKRTGLLRRALVAAQVSLALVLLVGSGLLMASFREVLAIDPGFGSERVLTGSVVLTENRYPEDADLRAFAEEALERARALPGVEEAGITSHVPFGGSFSDSVIFAEGYVMSPGESAISPTQVAVSPGYLETLDIRVLQGRGFDSRDGPEGRPVMLVDERLAERFWPDGNVVGKRMWLPDSAESLTDPSAAPHFDIVGVVESIQMRDLTSRREAMGAYYFPLARSPRRGLDFVVRTSGDPELLVEPMRRMLAELDPELAFYDVHTMEARIDRSLTDRRAPMLLTGVFSFLALALAAVGIYGMLSYLVQLRTREIGIRVALGSNPGGIFRWIAWDGLVVLGVGLALGLAAAWALGRFVESQLYGVSALEPTVIVATVGVLAAVALAACLLPARRATKLDPRAALGE